MTSDRMTMSADPSHRPFWRRRSASAVLPTFFVIGAMKAGTTSLHLYLDQHPEIHMSHIKEPHFFARPEDGPYQHRVDRLEDYLALFSSSVAVRGEASPTYSLYPRHKEVPERIADLIPDAKFIYLVRDPVDRIVSTYMHVRSVGISRRSLTDEIGDVSDPVSNGYVSASLYAMQLERYLSIYPKDRILVVDQAELLANRVACLQRIFEFLCVRSDFTSPVFANEFGISAERREFPSWYVGVQDRPVPSLLSWVPRNLRRSGRRVLERALWPAIAPPTLGHSRRQRLESIFAPDVARLREITGQRFPTWSV